MRRTIIYKGAEMPVKDAMRASGTGILPQTVTAGLMLDGL